jgi:hypothetical protein
VVAGAAHAQTTLTEASFEAATFKRNLSGADGWEVRPRQGGFSTAASG